MLQVKHLSKRFGAETILDDISFVINPAETVGLIGPNGSGKTTLLRCLVGDESPDSGELVLSPPGATIGYLPQSLVDMSDLTMAAAVAGARHELTDAERALTAAAEALASDQDTEAAMAAYETALDRLEALGGYAREHHAAAVLDGLGLGGVDPGTPVATLSGGQKTRLGLALLLIREPAILLLDEPTNHLDVEALRWLEGFVRAFSGAVLLVSHDREFLDQTVARVLSLDADSHRLTSYPGNYSDFAGAREREAAQQAETWTRQQEYVARVAADVARLKGEALAIERSTTPRQPSVRKHARRKAAVAKAREKKLDRYLAGDERVDKPRLTWDLKLDFGQPPPGGRAVLSLDDVGFAYPGGPPLFEGLTLDLQHGERLAIVGPNGAGKTTLLRLIAGELPPTAGRLRLGANVRLGLLSQEQETLDPERTVLELALRGRPMIESEARAFLHYFLFSGDDALRHVGDCSFGERTRLQLALLVLRGCNLLLLDEPLNHLDIAGREHFAEALDAFEGTVIAVVHDRAFLREFAERVVAVEAGTATVLNGGYLEYEARD